MLKYNCGICNSKSDQLSHHKSHLDTQKHNDKRSIVELQLQSLSKEALEQKYKTNNIEEIIDKIETKKILNIKEKTMLTKKKKTNTIIFEKSTDDILDTENNVTFKNKFLWS